MTEVIEATHVSPITTVDVFVVMSRYGDACWSAMMTYRTLDEAQQSVPINTVVQAWKIVKVSGLPV